MNLSYLWLDQDQVDEQDNKVMLDVLVGEPFAARALRQAHALAQRAVIGLGVCGVEGIYGKATFYAYRHWSHCWCVTFGEIVLERYRQV